MRQIAAAMMTSRTTPPAQQASPLPATPDDPTPDQLPLQRRRRWRRSATPSETWKPTHAGS